MFINKPLPLSQPLKVIFDSAYVSNHEFKFSDTITKLDNVILIALALHTSAVDKSADQVKLLTDAELKKGFLTLANKDNVIYNELLPLETFFQNQNFILLFEPKVINLGNCKLNFPDSNAIVFPGVPVGQSAKVAALFTMFYEKYDPVKHVGVAGI